MSMTNLWVAFKSLRQPQALDDVREGSDGRALMLGMMFADMASAKGWILLGFRPRPHRREHQNGAETAYYGTIIGFWGLVMFPVGTLAICRK